MLDNLSNTAKSVYKDYIRGVEEGFDVIDVRDSVYRNEITQSVLMTTPYKHNGNTVYAYGRITLDRDGKGIIDLNKRRETVNTVEFYEDGRIEVDKHFGQPTIDRYCPSGCCSLSEPIVKGFDGPEGFVKYDDAHKMLEDKITTASMCEHVMTFDEYKEVREYRNSYERPKYAKYGDEIMNQIVSAPTVDDYDKYLTSTSHKLENPQTGKSDFVFVGIKSAYEINNFYMSIAEENSMQFDTN